MHNEIRNRIEGIVARWKTCKQSKSICVPPKQSLPRHVRKGALCAYDNHMVDCFIRAVPVSTFILSTSGKWYVVRTTIRSGSSELYTSRYWSPIVRKVVCVLCILLILKHKCISLRTLVSEVPPGK